MNIWMRNLKHAYGIGYYMEYTTYTPIEWYVVDDFGNLIQVR